MCEIICLFPQAYRQLTNLNEDLDEISESKAATKSTHADFKTTVFRYFFVSEIRFS